MTNRNLLLGLGAGALVAAAAVLSVTPASALPVPVVPGSGIAGEAPLVQAQYRRYRHGGVRYYRSNPVGAAVAGAALGIIGGAVAAATAPRYYEYPYGYGYYGGYAPVIYDYPAYGYGYAPSYGYYPGYGSAYPGYGYSYYGW